MPPTEEDFSWLRAQALEVNFLPLPATWQLGPLQADARLFGTLANLQGEADWQLPLSTFPGRGRVRYADRLVQARDTVFQGGGGTLRADATASLDDLGWQAAIAGNALGLSQVSPLLRGKTRLRAVPVLLMGLAGGLALNGTLAGLSADGAIALTDDCG